ncbi:autotransporter outer membrane beta-barrel domain-containing protein [Alienimonas californiensis]|uniref:autotransporter outer membrane beta-barrel domain-containing protein n=1 Tax=Alienimonas californiensis TaxID=2527989 RepID=UPI0011A0DDFC|nr:autotransporter outer membrane beta-barrel domain-containing protein [Alienimonas californiensis]
MTSPPCPDAPRRPPSGRRSVLRPVVAIAAALLALPAPATAQVVDVGGFTVVFHNATDGDYNFGGVDNIAAADLGNWTAAEQTAVLNTFQYWTDTLNLPTAAANPERPIIYLVKDSTIAPQNANARPAVVNNGGVLRSNTSSRLVDGFDAPRIAAPGSTPARPGQDGRIIYGVEGLGALLDPTEPTQLATGFSLQRTSIHEVGHLLGFVGDDPYVNNINGAGNFIVAGGAVDRITGGVGVPIAGDNAHTLLQYHNMTRANPFGTSFRNMAAFGPAELAILADIGYDTGVDATLDLDEHFGGARYFTAVTGTIGFNDNVAGVTGSGTTWVSAQDYSLGYFLQTDGSDIVLVGDTQQTGFATAGVRIAGEDTQTIGDRVTVSTDSNIEATGDSSVGVLVSSGANNWITHRGGINLTGADTVGLQFDFGGPFGTAGPNSFQVGSGDYGAYLVDRVDLSGTVIADTAIFIDDSAAVREINLLRGTVLAGPALTGDIISNAYTDATLIRPILTFGRDVDLATGRAVGAGGDGLFDFTYDGDIGGTTPVFAEVYGGTSTMNGDLLFRSFNGLGGQMLVNGSITNQLGTTLTGGDLSIEAGADGALAETVVDSGVLNVAGVAATGGNDLTVNGIGGAAVTGGGVLTVDDLFVNTGGTVVVTDAGTLNGDDVTVNQGFVTLAGAGDMNVDTVTVAAGGTVNVSSALATLDAGAAAAVDGAGSLLQSSGGGGFNGATLALTDDGDALVTGAGSTFTLTGAATVDGAGSGLVAQSGGDFDGTTLALTNDGDALVTGAGSTFTLTGAAAVDGAGSTLSSQFGGALTADSATQTGGLIHVGTGSTTTFANDVTVNGGETRVNGTLTAANLLINSGGLLTGGGTIVSDLAMNGRLAVGNSPAVLNVVGNFTSGPGAITDLELQAATAPVAGIDFDQTAVTGTATVNGGTVNVQPFGNQNFAVGTRYDFLTAAGGLTVLNPVTVFDPLANVRFIQQIDPNVYALILARDQSFAAGGATFNTRQVGAALDAVGSDPALADLRNALDTLPTEAAAQRALNQLSGEIYGTHLTALNRSSLQFLDVIGGQGGASPLACGSCEVNGLQGWMEGYGGDARIDGDGNAFDARTGSGGAAVGLSRTYYGPNECISIGGFYAFESLTTRAPQANSTITDKVLRAGGTVKAVAGSAYARLSGFGGMAFGDATRSFSAADAVLPFADRTAAETDATLAGGDAELGMLFGVEESFVTPVVGVQYMHVDRDGFTEDGGATALLVDDSTLKEVRPRVGLRAGRWIPLAVVGPSTATFEAFYSRDVTAGSIGDYRARFDAVPTAAFDARGTDFSRDRFTLGPGLTIGEGPVRLATQYRAGLTETSVLHSGDVRLEVCY